MSRWFTREECAAELRISIEMVDHLLRSRKLTGYNLQGKAGWRILDPSPELRRLLIEPDLERAALVSTAELAEILGIPRSTLIDYVHQGHLKPTGEHSRGGLGCRFSASEIRRFIAWREGRKGPGKQTYLEPIVRWMRSHLAGDTKQLAAVIDQIQQEASMLPEPERSKTVYTIMVLFDQLNDILLKCRKNGPSGQIRTDVG